MSDVGGGRAKVDTLLSWIALPKRSYSSTGLRSGEFVRGNSPKLVELDKLIDEAELKNGVDAVEIARLVGRSKRLKPKTRKSRPRPIAPIDSLDGPSRSRVHIAGRGVVEVNAGSGQKR